MSSTRWGVVGVVVLAGLAVGPAWGTEVWTGYDLTFTKADSADWNLPENQDRITDNVRITRKASQGIFNIAQETGYTVNVSPADTEWAYGNAADWQSLTFQSWQVWNGSNPPSMLNRDAVVHLISDDIYLDIRFTSWTTSAAGGGFSYIRAVPEPGAFGLVALGGLTLLRRR